MKVSQTSYDYTQAYWDRIGATIVGRHVFDMTDGWDGNLGRDRPRGRRDTPAGGPGAGPRGRFTSSTASRQPWPRRRSLRVTAWSRSPLATSVARCLPRAWSTRCEWTSYPSFRVRQALLRVESTAQHLLEDPDVMIQSNRVLHLRYRVPPLTDLSGYAKKSTTNGETWASGCVCASLSLVGQPTQHQSNGDKSRHACLPIAAWASMDRSGPTRSTWTGTGSVDRSSLSTSSPRYGPPRSVSATD